MVDVLKFNNGDSIDVSDMSDEEILQHIQKYRELCKANPDWNRNIRQETEEKDLEIKRNEYKQKLESELYDEIKEKLDNWETPDQIIEFYKKEISKHCKTEKDFDFGKADDPINDKYLKEFWTEENLRKIIAEVDRDTKQYEADRDPVSYAKKQEEKSIVKSAKLAWEPREPIKYIVEDIIPEKSVSVWIGKYGSKKTYSCFSAAVCVALGKPWLGYQTIQSPVLYIDEENGEDEVLDRIKRGTIGEDGESDIPLFYTTYARFNLFQHPKEDAEKIKNIVAKCGAKIVFIDSLRDIMSPGDENKSNDIQVVFTALKLIAEETGIAIVVLHHENKNGGYSGSTNIIGASNVAFIIKSEVGSKSIKFSSEKIRRGEPIQFDSEIIFDGKDGPFYMIKSDAIVPWDDDVPTDNEKIILDYFKSHNGQCTVKDLMTSVQKEKYGSVRKTFYNMVKDGKFTKIGETKKGAALYKMV